MCDSSQTADALAQSTDLDVWQHATSLTAAADNRQGVEDLGPYSPKKLTGAGRYVVLINGSTDAAFIIESAKWTSATGASAVPGDRGTSIAVEGSIRVSEPKGIAFLDQVVKSSVALGVDASQVVYVLKTFFVGHGFDNSSGEDFVDHITDIPPVTFISYDVTGSFTEQGGVYDMLFVGAGHGASRLPQYSKAVSAMNITAGESLQRTLARLQDVINENYDRYFDCVQQQISAIGGDQAKQLLRSLRKVKYVIEVGADYRDTNGQVKYIVTNQPQQFKNGSSCNDPVQASFPANTSIESAISTIMAMSPQVLADMVEGDSSTSVKYEYKIHTALVSQQAADAEEGVLEYTVYYRVERFIAPKAVAKDPSFEVLAQDDAELNKDERFQLLRRNIIEFDYLYTGKNVDILEFDMKLNMGLAYLQTATLANTFKSQLEVAPNRVMQPSVQDVDTFATRFGAMVQTPVFFGTQIKTPAFTNANNSSHSIQSAYTLSKHSSLEVTDVSMKIVGNLELLGATNRSTSPENVVRQGQTPTSSEQPFAGWALQPSYAKVKIKMPRENDDFALFTGQSTTGDPRTDPGATDYARDFWFDGYYYIVGVDHQFEQGEFTQVLQLLGIPKKSSLTSTQNAPAKQEPAANQAVGSCFDNSITIPPQTTSTPPTVPTTPPAGTPEPTNRQDAATVNNNVSELSQVRGWDKADPKVRAAIIDASNKYGVDPVVMAQFAAKESSFNPNAKAPTSSATGLYQFLTGTWAGLVKQGKVLGVNSTTPDVRTDPLYNAYAGAAFLRDNAKAIGSNDVGDLYLAHFLGPGTAAKVIAADRRSGGNELVSSALGAEAAAKISKANPTIVKPNTTVGELRAWAAKSMAKLLINPVAVARKQEATPPPPASAAGAPQASTPPSPTDTSNRTADKAVATAYDAKVQNTPATPCTQQPNKG